MQIGLSEDEIKLIAGEVSKQLAPLIVEEIKRSNGVKHLMSIPEFIEYVDISRAKCSQLINQAGFYPVTRELGRPKIVMPLFFQWLEENADRRKEFSTKHVFKAM
ncbi:hypothetical protein FLK61_34285 [Paenalkalicoccus suaedae]|uniref:Uncharacterized protein n=1 Tax=Paenalkalicoccus suaedae TaxID=2592382 RepID=A0A859FEB5_9BACI|nr:hypothetical protein [Paenalkalicoccus suaedae]QKS71693.1 hypothetical protein FLK61_33990 [Paenalkalicoccus suaedae]QKS71747.1 hypothetical protein FLK61_34285 [Paenalkalicoccus suaedae]